MKTHTVLFAKFRLLATAVTAPLKTLLLPIKAEGYCPEDGSALVNREDIDGRIRLSCKKRCGFVHYDNPKCSAVVLAVRDGQVLLTQRKVPPAIEDWCLPGGWSEAFEDPDLTAARELREETGLYVRPHDLQLLVAKNAGQQCNATVIVYFASEDVLLGTVSASDDALDAKFFTKDSMPQNIAFENHRQLIEDYFAGKFKHLEPRRF